MPVKLILPLLITACFSYTIAQAGFERTTFYTVIMSQNLKEIDTELGELEKSSGREAFKGALLMKKAGLMTENREKLVLFKKGHKDLELSIFKDSSNTEYRFLRLLIQENAPKFLSYNKEIKKDAALIRKQYKNLQPGLQKVILNYSKTSKELNPEDFKTAAHG